MAVKKRFIFTRRPPPLPAVDDYSPTPVARNGTILCRDRRTSHSVGKRARIASTRHRPTAQSSTAASTTSASTTAANTTAVTAARALTQPDNRRVAATAGSSTLADRPYVASLVCSAVRSVRSSRLVRVLRLRMGTDYRCAYFWLWFRHRHRRPTCASVVFPPFKPRSCCAEIKTKK